MRAKQYIKSLITNTCKQLTHFTL